PDKKAPQEQSGEHKTERKNPERHCQEIKQNTSLPCFLCHRKTLSKEVLRSAQDAVNRIAMLEGDEQIRARGLGSGIEEEATGTICLRSVGIGGDVQMMRANVVMDGRIFRIEFERFVVFREPLVGVR